MSLGNTTQNKNPNNKKKIKKWFFHKFKELKNDFRAIIFKRGDSMSSKHIFCSIVLFLLFFPMNSLAETIIDSPDNMTDTEVTMLFANTSQDINPPDEGIELEVHQEDAYENPNTFLTNDTPYYNLDLYKETADPIEAKPDPEQISLLQPQDNIEDTLFVSTESVETVISKQREQGLPAPSPSFVTNPSIPKNDIEPHDKIQEKGTLSNLESNEVSLSTSLTSIEDVAEESLLIADIDTHTFTIFDIPLLPETLITIVGMTAIGGIAYVIIKNNPIS